MASPVAVDELVRSADEGTGAGAERLVEATLRRRLDETPATARWHCAIEPTTPSTNATLLERLRSGIVVAPSVLATDRQSAGRGRRGRAWVSAPGASITASFALAVDRPLSALGGATLACGLAVRDALRPLGVDARLKWPNDVLVEGRKLAGILVETAAVSATVLVVGVGLNVRRVDAGAHATDLASRGVERCDRERLIAAIAASLAGRLAVFEREGFAALMDEFDAVDAFRGGRVVVQRADDAPLHGVARGVDASGALRIDTACGPLAILAGEVTLRPADPP